jgi:catechol 2,3-dioxygenase-like lactoylglutathione lyase family enzyme
MINNIRHSGIVVNDLAASLHFYKDLLGLKVIKQIDESGSYIDNILGLQAVKVTTVKMAASDGQMIELLKYHTPESKQITRRINDIGLTHIAFTVDNLCSEYERLKERGIIFNFPPQLSPDSYAKVTFCVAPEGTFIELVEVL